MSGIKAGKYKAKIIDADIWTSKKGDPLPVIMFEFLDESNINRQINWFGSLNGGARQYTVEALVKCGFNSMNLADLTKGKSVLSSEEFEIVVEMQPNPSKNNEMSPRVRYINVPGSTQFKEKMSHGQAVTLCGGLNLGADFMEAKKKFGKVEVKQLSQEIPQEEDLPF